MANDAASHPGIAGRRDGHRKLVDSFELSASKAKTLIQESQKAHQSGDDAGLFAKRVTR